MKLPSWHGERCAVIAGGPSVTHEAVEAVRRAGLRVITINNAYLLAPWADMMYFCDKRWWEWHRDDAELQEAMARARRGELLIATLDNTELLSSHPYLLSFKNTGRHGIEREAMGVRNGSNSGYQVLNIALHLGVREVLLIGYDMRAVDGRMHWHPEHPIPTPSTLFESLLLPAFKTLAPELAAAGMIVKNCCVDSALDVFPRMTLEEALGGD